MDTVVSQGLGTGSVIEQVVWLIRLRWLAVVGLIVSVFLVDEVFPVALASRAHTLILVITAIIAVYNFLLSRRLPAVRVFLRTEPLKGYRAVKRLIHIQIIADLLCLTVTLNLAGGLLNPLCLFMIFHIAIAGIMLSRLEAFSVAVLATVLLVVIGLLGLVAPSMRLPLVGFPLEDAGGQLAQNGFYIFSVCVALAITFFLIAFFTSSVSSQLQRTLVELEKANDVLRQQDEARTRFLRVIAHQLRAPLAAVISLTKAHLDTTTVTPAGKLIDLIGRVERRCEALMLLIDDLLRLTHIQEGLNHHERTMEVDINAAIADVCELYRAQAVEKGLELNIDIDSKPACVKARPRDVSDILSNLVSNAIKYTKQGRVDVTGQLVGNQYILHVSDTGIGVPEKDRERLFEEFYRAGNAKDQERHSSGLGLNIVEAIVVRLGGNVSFESQEGQGTTFTVKLPLYETGSPTAKDSG